MHIGIDLAWGTRSRTGLAAVDAAGRLVDSTSVTTDDEIAAWLSGREVGVVAIDAPIIVPNETGRRPGESELGAAYARFHAGAHSTNLRTRHMAPPRARCLSERSGWNLDPFGARPVALEVYPHPGMIALLRLPRVLPYKGKPGRSVEARKRAFDRLFLLMEGIPETELECAESWPSIRERFARAGTQAALDRLEDEVDAVFCAHLAWLWAERPGALRMYGDLASGYIAAPPPPEHAPGPHPPEPR